MSKNYLVFMCGPDSLEDLEEMVLPIIDIFDGIVATCHAPNDSAEAKFLESEKKAGAIIYIPYSRRHDFSRNAYLYCGPIKNGDWCVQTDVLERPQKEFLSDLPARIAEFKNHNVNFCYYYGKPFLFEYHESMRYVGSPHESLLRGDGQASAIELNVIYPDESKVRKNIRPLKRKDPFGWVDHYAKYMMFPWGSNHGLLGLEHRGNPHDLFPKREKLRLEFLKEMDARGFDRTLDGLNAMFSAGLDDRLKYFINNEKVWQDYYRYHFLKDSSVVDEHEWTSLKKFE